MRTLNRSAVEPGQALSGVIAAFFFLICTWTSYARWAGFEYRTFDLAYYVQAIWQLIHGRLQVSVEHVPLLGNHVEPIVFLFAPFFFFVRHPLLFVVVQNVALASMSPVAYRIARRLGFETKSALLLSTTILLTSAAGYIALHEFHPEALAAPFLLLMYEARLAGSRRRYWLWFVAVLACKENMALLLAAFCVVQFFLERKAGGPELRAWYVWPLALATLWFAFCSFVVTPTLNSGNIDYVALSDRLGSSPGNILWNAIVHPQRMSAALFRSLHGNLFWGILLPFLGLPLLRPRWILISLPILLQHLLSWRSSEWMIYFHYAAPLLPLFWIASVEALAQLVRRPLAPSLRHGIPWLLVFGGVVAQIWLGPLQGIVATTANWVGGGSERARKNEFIAQIPKDASVVAPLPYLSHLAEREKLYSLHYILKGLKTLSRVSYEPPPPTDFVLVDYGDSATFDSGAGYYHPAMKTADDRVIPSSDRLLHDFLKGSSWSAIETNELASYKKGQHSVIAPLLGPSPLLVIGSHTELLSVNTSGDSFSKTQPLEIKLIWRFHGEREVFPWMLLRISNEAGIGAVLTKGLCVPEAENETCEETWRLTKTDVLAPGNYSVEAVFIDNAKRAWYEATGGGDTDLSLLGKPVPLGKIRIDPAD